IFQTRTSPSPAPPSLTSKSCLPRSRPSSASIPPTSPTTTTNSATRCSPSSPPSASSSSSTTAASTQSATNSQNSATAKSSKASLAPAQSHAFPWPCHPPRVFCAGDLLFSVLPL